MPPINTTYQFVTAGDYVDFFVNNNLQVKLSKDSNIIAWYFDDQPGIVFKVNGGTYFTGQPEDISFDGVPLGSKEGFVTAIKAMFPVYAGGGGATPGIDTVLAQGQALTDNRTIDLATFILSLVNGTISLEGNASIQSLRLINLSEYADNAAAIADGLGVGFVYRSGDNLKIVH